MTPQIEFVNGPRHGVRKTLGTLRAGDEVHWETSREGTQVYRIGTDGRAHFVKTIN